MAEVNDLQEVVAHGAAWLAIRQMTLDLSLFAQLELAVYVFRYEFLTIRAKHVNHPLFNEDSLRHPPLRLSLKEFRRVRAARSLFHQQLAQPHTRLVQLRLRR